jgi:hypothetical protein
MNRSDPSVDDTRCPLCGQANDCQLSSSAGWKGPCWCAKVEIPRELIAQVPLELRNRACICRACVESYHRQRAKI